MNRSLSGAGAVLALLSLACTRTGPDGGSLLADLEATIASQQVVNHYLFTSVTPKANLLGPGPG
jgi:hypothetical protein